MVPRHFQSLAASLHSLRSLLGLAYAKPLIQIDITNLSWGSRGGSMDEGQVEWLAKNTSLYLPHCGGLPGQPVWPTTLPPFGKGHR